MASEKTPLVSSSPTPTAYFLDGVHKRKPSSAGEVSFDTTFSRAEGEEVDNIPKGGVAAEFNPRPVLARRGNTGGTVKKHHMKHASIGGGFLDYIAPDSWKSKPSVAPTLSGDAVNTGDIGTLLIPRKVPIKVEPKVHFANERTFLAWLHVVVILAAASMTIVTYGKDENIVNQLYGVVLLPVSVAFMFYAAWQYLRRSYMINNRTPGPYIDVIGPSLLTIILMTSIIAQFCVKLHSLVYE